MKAKDIRKEYNENKEFYGSLFDELTKQKYEKCKIKDKFGKGKDGFDYLKMSEMYHKGEW